MVLEGSQLLGMVPQVNCPPDGARLCPRERELEGGRVLGYLPALCKHTRDPFPPFQALPSLSLPDPVAFPFIPLRLTLSLSTSPQKWVRALGIWCSKAVTWVLSTTTCT